MIITLDAGVEGHRGYECCYHGKQETDDRRDDRLVHAISFIRVGRLVMSHIQFL